jgi:hypothetical protein
LPFSAVWLALCFYDGMNKRLVLLALWLTSFGASADGATTIEIQNHSFENPVLSDGGLSSTAPGWTALGLVFISNPAFSQAPHGQNQGSIHNDNGSYFSGSISQAVSAVVTANTAYTFQIYVGARTDTLHYPFSTCQISISAIDPLNGPQLLAMFTTSNPLPGTFDLWTLTYTAGPADAHLGLQLQIGLNTSYTPSLGGGSVVLFDNAELTAVSIPEPQTLWLVAAALTSLVMRIHSHRFVRKRS